ncbi:MAG: winged helix-turn-helix domain-containing protein [Gammaproteobacteria bacterium]|nr:winged helix-turn-helix domain-containing protein [Gammaproteobacteria bacterium]MDH5302734.1 winged helix-turn-helix domain-containing protein [Gammaproteobacteria bacterium]MDH5321334.1 winged helix-turn-helix domain-containing protein [Gammaproteobacteria bacterium]
MSESSTRPDGRAARRHAKATQIGERVLLPDIGVLRGPDGEARLNDKTLHVLLVLLEAGDSGVSRDAILDRVWGSSYPSDGVVSRAIADLRAAFGEKAGEQKFIRTLPKFGYQFVADHRAMMPGETITGAARRKPAPWRRTAYSLLVAAIVGVLWLMRDGAETTEFVLPPPVLTGARPLTSAPGLEHQPRHVPGGDWVVYAAMRQDRNDWDLFRVSTADGTSQPVAVTPGVHEHGPAISPSGEELAYVRLDGDDCSIVVQSVVLGVPETLASCSSRFPTLVDWSPAGDQLAYTVSQPDDADQLRRIHMVDRHSGDGRQVTQGVSSTGTDFYPRFSPSGRQLAFLRGEPQPDHRTTIWLVDIESGEESQLTTTPTQTGGMTWLDEHRLLYSVSDGGAMHGRWLDIRNGASSPIEFAQFMHPEFLPESNSLLVVQPRSDSDLALLEADGDVRMIAVSTGADHHGTLSPDESWVAFISARSGFDELWIAEAHGDLVRRLTRFDGAAVRYPDWHPDGQKILFTVQADDGEQLYEVDLVSGTPRRIKTGFADVTTPRWLADGSGWIAGCHDGRAWGICTGSDTTSEQLISDYYRPRPTADGRIYVIDKNGALFELNLHSRSVAKVWDGLPGNGRYGWAVAANVVYLLDSGEQGGASRMVRYDLGSGRSEVLFEGAMPLADMNLSIGGQSGDILFTQLRVSSDDIVMYENVVAVPRGAWQPQ